MPDGPGLRGISAKSAEAAALGPDLGSRAAAVGRAGLIRAAGPGLSQQHTASRCDACVSWPRRSPCLVRFCAADGARDGTVVLDGAAAAIRLPQPPGAAVFVDGGRQCILRRAMGAAAKPRARSDRAAARGSDAAGSRLETVPGHGFRPDHWWSDLAEPRCHRRVARLAATCFSAALQSDFSVGLCQLPVRDRRRAGRHSIVARSRTEAIVGEGACLVGCGAPLLFQPHCCSWVLCAGYLGG